jgi:cytochrome b-561
MTLGMIFFYGDGKLFSSVYIFILKKNFFKAILAYRVFRDVKKLRVKILHGSLLALSLIFASIGLKAVFDNHNLADPPKPNLYSLHSWVGLTAVVLFGLQWVCGFVSFLFPKLNENIRKAYMPR